MGHQRQLPKPRKRKTATRKKKRKRRMMRPSPKPRRQPSLQTMKMTKTRKKKRRMKPQRQQPRQQQETTMMKMMRKRNRMTMIVNLLPKNRKVTEKGTVRTRARREKVRTRARKERAKSSSQFIFQLLACFSILCVPLEPHLQLVCVFPFLFCLFFYFVRPSCTQFVQCGLKEKK